MVQSKHDGDDYAYSASKVIKLILRVMRETLGGFQDGLQTGGRMVTNLRYADDIILLATSEAELQELVYRLDRVSRCMCRGN